MKLSQAIEGFMLAKRADGFSEETLKLYSWAYDLLKRRIGDPEVKEITEAQIQAFWGWLRTEYTPKRRNGENGPLAGRSLENIWTAERSLFGWIETELGMKRPDAKIKRPKCTKEEIEPFTEEDIKHMLDCCECANTAKTNSARPSVPLDQADFETNF